MNNLLNRYRRPLHNAFDLDAFLAHPRVLISTPIEDPHSYTSLNQSPFNLSVEDAVKELHPEFTSRGGEYEQARESDFLYSFKLHVEVHPVGVPESQSNPVKLDINVIDESFDTIKKIRHDFVATKCMRETDVSFREIGVPSGQTPDYIDRNTMTVVELATNASGAPKSMESSYVSKRIQYENLCNEHNLNYIILIVTRTGVLTNTELSQQEVDDLSLRCRIGLNIESELVKAFDMDISSDDDLSRNQKFWKTALSEWNSTRSLPSNESFSTELNDLDRPLSDAEEMHVSYILRKTLKESIAQLSRKGNPNALVDYLAHFTGDNSRSNDSQITIFPLIWQEPSKYGERGSLKTLGFNRDVPPHVWAVLKHWDDKQNMIMESITYSNFRMKTYELAREQEMIISSKKYNETPSRKASKHLMRESFKFTPLLTQDEVLGLALRGVGAKELEGKPEILAKEAFKKKSFHPDTDVRDIDKFWNAEHDMAGSDELSEAIFRDDAIRMIMETKNTCEENLTSQPESIALFSQALHHPYSRLGSMITDICTEISMEYKVPTREGEWLVKPLRRHKAIVFIKCTGTHTFFFTAHDKESSHILETGKLGPDLWETENYWVSNIVSISEPYLEHFIKAESYIPTIYVHLMSSFNIPVLEKDWSFPSELSRTFSYILLTYLNNKIDHEEMITNLRFLYMKLFQEAGANCNDYVERLPDVLRSRLSVFTLRNITRLMQYYSKHRIIRKAIKLQEGTVWEHKNIKTIFHPEPVTLEQLVDSFYYAYVVTKEKSTMGDHTFIIFSKVVKEEWEYQDNVVGKKKKPWGQLHTPEKHRWDWMLERKKLEVCDEVLRRKHGPAVMDLIHNSIWNGMSSLTFNSGATLKASAKKYDDGIKLPDVNEGLTKEEYKKEFRDKNKHINKKRPRVLSRLVDLVNLYMATTNESQPDYLKMALWVMDYCMRKGIVLSDLFQKDQHNGVREIHVLDIMAKHIQSVTENIAKSICRYFENDTVSSPESKKHFYRNHIDQSDAELGQWISVNKSADASKWCQRNHVSQFYFQMKHYTPKELHPFLYCFYYLWTRKRIMLPMELLRNLDLNTRVHTTNPTYKRMMNCFQTGELPFLENRGPFIQVSSGMFQGILHYASCLKHDIAQTHWKFLMEEFMSQNLKTKLVTTIVQGSDDSGAMISTNTKNMGIVAFLIAMLWWKEKISTYSSIWTSEAKSSIGTVSLIEYNSEWYMNGRVIKPMFRWVSAAMSTSFTERFPSRVEQFYNAGTQCVESGSPLLTVATIQMFQALLHYRMIGIGTHPLSNDCSHMILKTKNPSLGYFPLECDQICGISGFDYQLYLLALKGVNVQNWELEEKDNDDVITYDSKVDKIMRESIRNYQIKMSNIGSYLSVLQETGLPRLNEMLEKIEEHPELLYGNFRTWEQEQLKMAITLDMPSVKLSLSSHQPVARLMSASAYIMNTPCITTFMPGIGKVKRSLWRWLSECQAAKTIKIEDTLGMRTSTWFVNQDQYEEFTRFVSSMKNTLSYQPVHMRRTNRVDVMVWGSRNSVDIPLIDLVKRRWFNMSSVKCSRTAFMNLWNSARVKYPFLRDTYPETKKMLGLEDLSIYRVLQSISKKTRVVRLSDSSAKGNDLWSVATRIFWPDVKVRSSYIMQEVGIRELKHALHCLTTYFYKRDYVVTKCTEIIRGNTTLARMNNFTLDSAFKLKVFQDVLLNKGRWEIIGRIEKSRQGVIGYFSRRQSKQEMGYGGKGVWVGLINSVPCKIEMMNQEIESVTVRQLSDTRAQGKAIKGLIREFRLKYPKSGPKSRSFLYLPEYGELLRSNDRPENSIPFLIDRSFNPDIKTKLLDQEWELDCDEGSVKLVFRETDANEKAVRYTILSESYGHTTWDPLLPAPDVPDENFRNWCQGIPCKPVTLLEQLRLPIRKNDVVQTKFQLKENRYVRPDTEYDLRKFLKTMRNFLTKKTVGLSFVDYKDDLQGDAAPGFNMEGRYEPTMDEIMGIKDSALSTLKELQDTGRVERLEMVEGFEEATRKIGAAFDYSHEHSDSEENNSDEEDAWDDDSELLMGGREDEIMDIFGKDDPAILEMRAKAQRVYIGNVMQIEKFLGPYLSLLEDMSNSREVFDQIKTLSEESEVEVSGPAGVVTYLLYPGLDYVDTYRTDLSRALEISTIGDFVSMSSAQGATVSDLHRLQEEERQILELLPSLTGPLLSSMQIRLAKVRGEIEYAIRVQEADTSTDIIPNLSKTQFLELFIDLVEQEEMWPERIPHPQKKTRIEILVSQMVEKLSIFEQYGMMSSADVARAQASAWSSVLSREMIIALCLYLGTRLTVKMNNEVVFEYRKTYLTGDLLMEI